MAIKQTVNSALSNPLASPTPTAPINTPGVKHSQYGVFDADGNRVDTLQELPSGAKAGSTIYKTDGGYTTTPPVSLSFNKETNKVKLVAPEAVLNSDWVKKNYTENATFKRVVELYRQDPNGNTTIQVSDADGNVTEKTISDWMDEQAGAFQEYAGQYMEYIYPLKQNVQGNTASGIQLSDEQAVIAMSSLDRDTFRNDNKTAVYLPSDMLRFADFEGMESWNEETQTVSAKDFYDWYNLDDDKGKDIREMQKALEWKLAYLYSAKEYGEGDAEELARTMSFYKTLSNDKPDANFFQATGLFLDTANLSFQQTLVDASVSLYSFAEAITVKAAELTSPATTVGQVLAVGTLGASVLANVALSTEAAAAEQVKINATNFGEFLAGIDGNPDEQGGVLAFTAFADIQKGLIEGKGKETIEHWAKATNTPLNQEASQLIDKFYDDINAERTDISNAAGAGRAVGIFVGEVVKQIVLTNTVGGLAGRAVAGGVTGLAGKIAVNYGDDAVAAVKALQDGMTLYAKAAPRSQTVKAFIDATSKVAGAAGFGANIMAQGFVDTVLNDPEVVEDLLLNSEPEDAQDFFAAIMKNAGYNAFGEVSGFGVSLLGRARRSLAETLVRETTAGAAAEAALKRGVNRLAGMKHTALARFADWMAEGNSAAARALDSVFKASDQASRWYNALHWQEAEAAFKVADAAKGAASAEEAIEATSKAILEKMDIEVSLNRTTRGIMREWSNIVNNPAIAKSYDSYMRAGADLARAAGGSVYKNGLVDLPQEVSNYLALQSKVAYYANKEASEVGLRAVEKAHADALTERLAKISAGLSSETKAAADNVLTLNRAYQKSFMNFSMTGMDDGGLGVYNRAEIQDLRNTGFWGADGDEYIPLVAIKSGEDATTSMKNAVQRWGQGENFQAKTAVDEYSYKPGDVDTDYLNPFLATYAQQVTAAKIVTARGWGNALIATDALAKEIDLEGNAVSHREISKARAEVHKTAENVMRGFRVDDTILEYDLAGTYKKGTNAAVDRAEKRTLRILGLSKPEGYERAAYRMTAEDFAELRKQGLEIPTYGPVARRAELDELMNSLPKDRQALVEKALGARTLTVKHYNDAIRTTNLSEQLQGAYVATSKEIQKDGIYQLYVRALKERNISEKAAVRLKDAYDEYWAAIKENANRVLGADEFTQRISQLTEDMFAVSDEALIRGANKNKFMTQMLDRYAELGVPKKVAKRYLIAQEYHNYFAGSGSKKELNAMLDKLLENIDVSGNLTTQAKKSYKKAIRDALKENIDSEWAQSIDALKKAGGNDIIDAESAYDYIYKQMSDFVDTTVKSPNIIQTLDKNGQFHLYEVSPTTATLYKERPNLEPYANKQPWKFFNKTNRLARLGAVGYSLRSFTNQWMRDPLNAYVMGGMTHTLGKNANSVGEMLGPQVVEYMQEAMGKAGWKQFTEDLVTTLGREATQAEVEAAAREAASSVARRAAETAVGDLGLETAYYREAAKGYRDAAFGDIEAQAGMMSRALDALEEHSLGNFRETYLRKGVFAQSFNDAVSSGKTIKEAQTIAEFTMLNATTNFSRAFAWGNNITTSVSFLGAAINGNASFWRLLEVDPVGVSSRFINGLVIPMMALVSQSLQSDQDKEVYQSIPEYEKEDNVVFVVAGEKYKIPMPQELSVFLAPFRQAVEKAHDANKHTWAELIVNDILGTSAIDLRGFMDLDANTLQGDPTLADRLNSEAQALISQLSPTVVKTIYMAITGIDPFTGNPIDTSRVYIDQDGNEQIFDYKSTAFTTWLSGRLKDMGIELSGSAAHALIKTLVGSGFSDIFDMIGDMFAGEPSSVITTPAESVLGAFTSASADNQANFAWNQAVRELTAEKNRLLADESFANLSNALSRLDSSAADYEAKRSNLLRQYNQKIQDYQQRVYTTVKNLQAQYGATYDKNKFAATINLLTFYKTYGDSLSEAERQTNQQMFYNARSRAMQTMAKFGFDSPNDLSIFGYIRTNEYGEAEARANSPVAIMNQSNEVWGMPDRDIANIETILEQNNITRKEMFGDEYEKARAAGKKAYKAYKAAWNKKVVEVLAPYIQSRGVNTVLNSFNTRDVLDNYIFVSNPYKTREYLLSIFGE